VKQEGMLARPLEKISSFCKYLDFTAFTGIPLAESWAYPESSQTSKGNAGGSFHRKIGIKQPKDENSASENSLIGSISPFFH